MLIRIIGFGQYPYVTPRIDGSLNASGGLFPFPLSGKSLPRPMAIVVRVKPAYIYDWMLLLSFENGAVDPMVGWLASCFFNKSRRVY